MYGGDIVRSLSFDRIVGAEEIFHIGRAKYDRQHHMPLHDHDFSELFWVEHGSGIHGIRGQEERISAGAVRLVRPEDQHEFFTRSEGLFTIVNIAFRQEVAEHLLHRYFPTAGFPPSSCLWAPQVQQARAMTDELIAGGHSLLNLERFLLGVCAMVARRSSYPCRGDIPTWLSGAVSLFRQEPNPGIDRFVRTCGRCREHVLRTIHRCMNQTLTGFLDELRLDHAAQLLAFDIAPITEVALSAGFQNLSWFHRLFKKRFGQTPRQYRRRRRSAVAPDVPDSVR
jgi:AraC-like DNA-binding protein/quercetin dioxygenase-like cupin family protein